MSLDNVRRSMCCAAVVSMLVALAACSSTPAKDDATEKLAMQERANEIMYAADKALKAGKTDEAFDLLETAIKADPATKAPWLKKAQIHFDAHQYGQAITEAQEVLQRDTSDLTAKSILAVSGLRVSASALEQLRKINEVNGSTRSEAENVAKLIREALGEPILVAAPAPAASAVVEVAAPKPKAYVARAQAPRPAAPVVAKPTYSGQPAAPVATPSVKPTATPANTGAASGGRNNPFGALQ